MRESDLHTLQCQSRLWTQFCSLHLQVEGVRQVTLSTTLPFSGRVNMRQIRLVMLVGLNMGLSILKLYGRLDIFSLLCPFQ